MQSDDPKKKKRKIQIRSGFPTKKPRGAKKNGGPVLMGWAASAQKEPPKTPDPGLEVGNVSSQFENPGKNGGGKFFSDHQKSNERWCTIPETNSS